MSKNIWLGEVHGPRKTRAVFPCVQTTTEETDEILGSKDPKHTYSRQIRERFTHPAGTHHGQPECLDEWAQEHLEALEQFILTHPTAKWSYT